VLHKATLISRATLDGWEVIEEYVPLGKIYYVDLDSIFEIQHGQAEHPGVLVKRQAIMAYDRPDGREGGLMLLELLKIEADA
jgi:hypothetical protein